MKLNEYLGKFLKRNARERILLIEAVAMLGLSQLAVAAVPFRMLAPFLGRQGGDVPNAGLGEADPDANGVARAIRSAARHLPWDSKCLGQAVAGKLMLKRRGLPSTMYLGVAISPEATLEAHAWLVVGGDVLLGAAGARRFTVISTFV